jgi:hypothetical protein
MGMADGPTCGATVRSGARLHSCYRRTHPAATKFRRAASHLCAEHDSCNLKNTTRASDQLVARIPDNPEILEPDGGSDFTDRVNACVRRKQRRSAKRTHFAQLRSQTSIDIRQAAAPPQIDTLLEALTDSILSI